MVVFEWIKIIFNWFAGLIGVLFGLCLVVLFVTHVPRIVVKNTDSNSRIKRAALRTLCVFFILGVAALIIWAGPLAPKKSLVVENKELPKLDGSEGVSPAYCVYYLWDGEREEHPWWVIFQRPCDDGTFEWAILETADLRNIWDTSEASLAIQAAAKFDSRWFKRGMHRVKRTRAWKLRGILFGTDEKFEEEKKAIKHVLTLIESQKKIQ